MAEPVRAGSDVSAGTDERTECGYVLEPIRPSICLRCGDVRER